MEEEILEKRKQIMSYAKSTLNIPIDAVIKASSVRMMQKYNREEVRKYLENPSKNEEKLREIVDYLCTISPQFCRIIEYVPNMALITPFVKQKMGTYSNSKKNDKAKTDYSKMCDFYDGLNVKQNSLTMLKEVFKYGVYYGVNIEGAYGTYIKKLNPSFCKIISEGEMGYGLAFKFSYFNNNEYLLENGFPKEFKVLYDLYKKGTKTLEGYKLSAEWQPLPESITVCMKYDTTNLNYSVPPYVNVFAELYDLEEYKSLNKAKVTSENYTLIGLKIPLLNKADKEDDYAISNDMVDATSIQLDESLPEYMGYFTTACDIKEIKASSANTNNIDNVANATKNVFNSLGIAESQFGVDNSNSGTLKYSINVDTQQLYPLYDQLQKYWDMKLKIKFNNRFKLILIKSTWFNLEELIGYYKELSSLSVPVALILPLLLGFEVSDLEDISAMQGEELFDVLNNWKPLATSYTQSDNAVGSPPKKDGDLTASGEQTRSNESSTKR